MKASQNWRFAFLFDYVVILALINALCLGRGLFPPIDIRSTWFYAILLILLLSELLDQPFFTSPADAINNAVAVMILSFGMLFLPPTDFLRIHASFLWELLGLLSLSILFVAGLAIFLGRSDRSRLMRIAEFSAKFAAKFGSPRILLTPALILAIYSFHAEAEEIFWPFVAWILVTSRPLEHSYDFVKRSADLLKQAIPSKSIGNLLARREPAILEIRLKGTEVPRLGSLIAVILKDEKADLAITLSAYHLANETRLRALVFREAVFQSRISGLKGKVGDVVLIEDANTIDKSLLEDPIYEGRNRLKGIVIEQSTLEQAIVELIGDPASLEVGELFEIPVNNRVTLYQIIGATTDSESLVDRNLHGFNTAIASKIGARCEANDSFERVQWLPRMYSPVFLRERSRVAQTEISLDEDKKQFYRQYVGRIPGTQFGIAVDPTLLVTHNTAILGALGTGKTCLALELIDRIVKAGAKCLILDITQEYQDKLGYLYNRQKHDQLRNRLPQNLWDISDQNTERLNQFLSEEIENFLNDSDWRLLILNPFDFRLRTPHPWGGQRPPIVYTPSLITALISTQAFRVCQRLGFSETARLCLVLEEAHTLVPEFHALTTEDEKLAAPTTSRAILQGRKHGYGCLLISQRTALVTKSILNQCNTIFALRAYDATGEEFLKNYFGLEYTKVLSSLKDQHCVVYGKGIRNGNVPLLIELNHRERYLASSSGMEQLPPPPSPSRPPA